MALIIPPLFLWLSLLILVPLLVLLKRNPRKHPPPSPPKLPLVGHLHKIGPSPDHQTLFQLSKQYGPVMLLHLGRVPTVVISSAQAAKEVLKINDAQCCNRPTYAGSRRLTYNYLDLAYSPYTNYWREIRKICVVELFSVKRVQSYRSLREEEVAKLIDSIRIGSFSGEAIDLSDKLFALVASIIFRVGFGTSLDATKYKCGGDILKLLHDLEVMIGAPSLGEYFPALIGGVIDQLSGLHNKFDSIYKEVDGFFQQLVDDHLKPERRQEHEDIIDVLLQMGSDEKAAAQLGHDKIKAVLLNLVLGGIDATAVTMGSVMTEMARNPKIMKKAQEEVRKLVGNKGRVSESDTDELPYLKIILKETLRLHPPVPLMLPKESMSSFKVLGYDIDPKTQVIVNEWAIARDLEFWKKPEEFIPERFEGSSIDYKGQHFEYLPFGSGRRICPGIFLATTAVELAVANLLYSFDWKLPHGMKEEDVIVSKRNPLLLVPVKFDPPPK